MKRVSLNQLSVLHAENSYDAGSTGRRMRGWTPGSAGPNRVIRNPQLIRDRSRDTDRNTWEGAAATNRWTTTIVGTGIVPRPRRDVPSEKRKLVKALWNAWVPVADADGVLDFYGLETLAVRTWLSGGECFARLRERTTFDDGKVPLRVQLLESEYVPHLNADSYPGLPTNHIIREGVEFDWPRRQRVAYWFYKAHPQEQNDPALIKADDLVRVDARLVCHVFEPLRPGQIRGVSHLASVMARLRNIADFDDAVLDRQKLANLFTAFITQGIDADGNWNPNLLSGDDEDTDEQDVPAVGLEPGTVQQLAAGEDVKFANPPEAGTTYSEYMRTQHLGTAAGAHLPYELWSGDIMNVSDRTLRIVINEFRRFAKQRQWQIVIPQFCAKVRAAWARQAVLVGMLDVGDYEIAADAVWSPHGWEYIHPVQDPQGKQMEIELGLRSRSDVVSERGDDIEEVDEERKADQEREVKLGLKPDPAEVAAQQAAAANNPAAGNKPGAKQQATK